MIRLISLLSLSVLVSGCVADEPLPRNAGPGGIGVPAGNNGTGTGSTTSRFGRFLYDANDVAGEYNYLRSDDFFALAPTVDAPLARQRASLFLFDDGTYSLELFYCTSLGATSDCEGRTNWINGKWSEQSATLSLASAGNCVLASFGGVRLQLEEIVLAPEITIAPGEIALKYRTLDRSFRDLASL